MEFQIAESMCDIDHYLPIAQAADEVGFGVFALGDSILYPEVARDKYPYTATGDRGFLEGAPFLDPFQLFAAMSVVILASAIDENAFSYPAWILF